MFQFHADLASSEGEDSRGDEASEPDSTSDDAYEALGANELTEKRKKDASNLTKAEGKKIWGLKMNAP